jgi:hypothetical protein
LDVIKAMLIVVKRPHTVARQQVDVKNAGLVSIVNGGRNVLNTDVLRVRIMRNANQGTRDMVKDAEMGYGWTWTAKVQRIV